MWLLVIIILILILWFYYQSKEGYYPSTACGWLYFDIKNMTFGWTDDQANEAKDLCDAYESRCGEENTKQMVMNVYRDTDPFVAATVLPALKDAQC